MFTSFRHLLLASVFSSIALLSSVESVFSQESSRIIDPKNKVDCSSMKEEVSLSINFTSQTSSPLKAKEKYEARLKELDDAAHELKFKKWQVQNSNFSVSSMNYGNDNELGFQLSGSVNYITDDADKTFQLVEMLIKRGYTPSVNISKYRTDTCAGE